MAENQKGVLELLEQLRKERAEIDLLIQGLEKRLGIVPQQGELAGEGLQAPRVTVSIDSIPVGFFHNLSQADAAEKLLRLNKPHALKTKEILDAFRKSGMGSASPNALTILYTTLHRNPKFERVGGKAWGLAEWYPEKRKRKEDNEEQSEE